MNMPQPPPIARFLLATALLIIPTAAMAADAAASGQNERALPPQTQTAAASEPSFDLDFPGGSVTDLLQAIEKSSGRVPNVIVGDAADKVKIPPLRVRRIKLSELFISLREAGAGDWRGMPPPPFTTWALAHRDPRLPFPDAVDEYVNVFNIQPLLANRDIKDIVAAVQVTLEMEKNAGGLAAQLKYHKETQLLIVSGTGRQISMVNEVLRALAMPLLTGTKEPPRPQAPEGGTAPTVPSVSH